MRASAQIKRFIEGWEGRRASAYVCSAGHWTIGIGHMMTMAELGQHKRPLTDDEIDELFTLDLRRFEDGVTDLLAGNTTTTQYEFDAMLAFAFNCGLDIDSDDVPEGLGDSTLLKLHLRGKRKEAADEFMKWCKARVGGKLVTVPGLAKRRMAEREVYLYGNYSGRP